MSKFPFEATLEEIVNSPEDYVDSVFSCLESEFLVMPKGKGFIEYPEFEEGYEALKVATQGFTFLDPVKVYAVGVSVPISIIVLRTMLGFTPPEWGYVTTRKNKGFRNTRFYPFPGSKDQDVAICRVETEQGNKAKG